ncbi:efflux RND transporter periplasmic adaptor subunit [Achromobacter xylosoxidans]
MGLVTDRGFPYRGRLDFVGNQMDRGTGTIRVRAVLPNPDGQLAPGLFARARLATGEPRETVLVNEQAVGTDQGKNYVLVVGADNLAGYRPVELGRMVDGLRVIQSGLRAGERIIIKGLVRPGMAVTPRLVPMEPAAAAVPEARRQAAAAAGDAAAATEKGQ